MKINFIKLLGIIAMVLPVISSSSVLGQRPPERNEEGIIFKDLRDGDSATLIAPNRRGDFVRHEFTCSARGGGNVVSVSYSCDSYALDTWNTKFKLLERTILADGKVVEIQIADRLDQTDCLRRADEFRRSKRD